MQPNIVIRLATNAEEIDAVRELFREYAVYLSESVSENHLNMEDYERELAGLPGSYSAPEGVILLAWVDDQPAGCVCSKRLASSRALDPAESACELKRLWIRPAYRGQSIGLELSQEVIAWARRHGYRSIYLDTVPAAMKAANIIYQKLGFHRIQRAVDSPVPGRDPTEGVESFRLLLG